MKSSNTIKFKSLLYRTGLSVLVWIGRHFLRSGSRDHDPQKILCVALHNIGDAMFITPALRAIRKLFPNAGIHVLVRRIPSEVLRYNGNIDRLIVYDTAGRHKGVFGRLILAWRLRGYRYDLCLDFTNNAVAVFFVLFTAASKRVSVKNPGCTEIDPFRFIYTKELPFRRNSHHVDVYLDIARYLGAAGNDLRMEFPVSSEVRNTVLSLFEKSGLSQKDFIVAIVPGGSKDFKRWNPKGFAEVADILIGDHGARVVLLGGPDKTDTALRSDVLRNMANTVFDFGGKTLVEASAILSKCNLVISNDSGLMHIASSHNVPIVSLYGPSNEKTSRPLSDHYELIKRDFVPCRPCFEFYYRTPSVCRYGYPECIKEITVGEVMGGVERIFKRIS